MHIKPKKRLGQNFLVDKNIQHKIIQALELKTNEIILEIGSGRGEMTGLIAKNVERVFALEIDSSLCAILENNLSGLGNVEIINQDILKFNPSLYFKGFKNKIKVFGNIPYYISSPIIEHLLDYQDKIESIFITIQKEFAQRVVALPGSKDYGSLSCFVQYYSEPRIIFNIKKTSFLPVPKVDSSLIRIGIRNKLPLGKDQEKLFFKIVRAAFNKRRKTLRNSLEGIIPRDKLNMFFLKSGIDRNIRPEDLSQQDFFNLVKFIKKILDKI
jgi:16S rRNA (adenine1518-N6/adenine1519-N6)-dimethyltransferase